MVAPVTMPGPRLLALSTNAAAEVGVGEVTFVGVAGGPASFDDFFRDHYPWLVQVLTVASGDAALAEDCVQEAFVRAYLRWSRLANYDVPAAWVRKVAVNLLRDDARRTKRGRSLHPLLSRAETVEPAPAPSGIAAALANLPRQQRLCMSLYYLADMSVADVATALRLSEGAVKYHLNQGRERLRPLLSHD